MQKSLLKYVADLSATKRDSGQIAIVVLLIMVVLLILGLSLARRTSEEILLSGQTEDTTRVFNAAESGVEDALSKLSQGVDDPTYSNIPAGEGVEYDYSAVKQGSWEQRFEANEAATVYLDGTKSSIDISWNKNVNCDDSGKDKAALIVSIYYNNGDSVVHEAWKPTCFGDSKAPGFVKVSDQESSTYTNRKELNVQVADYPGQAFVRIRPLYAGTYLMIQGAPVQTYKITSVGSETSAAADGRSEQRTIEVTRTKPAPPSVFDYALYSGGSLEKPGT